MEQGQLFASNVVSLSEFRARRPIAREEDDAGRWPAAFNARPLSMRSSEHLARMLAHLSGVAQAAGSPQS